MPIQHKCRPRRKHRMCGGAKKGKTQLGDPRNEGRVNLPPEESLERRSHILPKRVNLVSRPEGIQPYRGFLGVRERVAAPP